MSQKPIELFDIVELRDDLDGVPRGVHGTVVDVHKDPELAYEVEFVSSDGSTIWLGALLPSQVARVSD